MGDFKEKHGKTRVGKLLEGLGDMGKPILQILSKAPIPGASLLNDVAQAIVKEPGIDQETTDMLLEAIEMDKAEMSEITERWKSDNTSDNFLSKNARPITLLYLQLVMTVLVIGDSAGWFVVKEVWVNLVEALLITVILSFFGSRGVEKFTKIRKTNG